MSDLSIEQAAPLWFQEVRDEYDDHTVIATQRRDFTLPPRRWHVTHDDEGQLIVTEVSA